MAEGKEGLHGTTFGKWEPQASVKTQLLTNQVMWPKAMGKQGTLNDNFTEILKNRTRLHISWIDKNFENDAWNLCASERNPENETYLPWNERTGIKNIE